MRRRLPALQMPARMKDDVDSVGKPISQLLVVRHGPTGEEVDLLGTFAQASAQLHYVLYAGVRCCEDLLLEVCRGALVLAHAQSRLQSLDCKSSFVQSRRCNAKPLTCSPFKKYLSKSRCVENIGLSTAVTFQDEQLSHPVARLCCC